MATHSPGCCYLPGEIISNILHRLAVKDITRFKYVSKMWMSLITDPNFVEAVRHKHLAENEEELVIILSDRLGTEAQYSYLTLDLDKENATPKQLLNEITPSDLGVNPKELFLWSSCNGLLLFEHNAKKNNLYILNPLTAEFVALPPLKLEKEKLLGRWALIKDEKYKVYGIFSHEKCLVLTQGDTKWTEIDIPRIIDRELYVVSQQPVFANGELHWLTVDQDPANEFWINPNAYYILSIHVKTGILTRTMIPYDDLRPESHLLEGEHLLSLVDGSLCIIIVTVDDVIMYVQDKVRCMWRFTPPPYDRFQPFKWNELFPAELKKFISRERCIIARRGRSSCILNFARNEDGFLCVAGAPDILKLVVHHDGCLFVFDFKGEHWRQIPFPMANKEQSVQTYYSVFHSSSLDSWKTSSYSLDCVI